MKLAFNSHTPEDSDTTHDILMFVEVLLSEYRTGHPLVQTIEDSAAIASSASKKAENALKAYRCGITAEAAFSRINTGNNAFMQELFSILASGLDSGADITQMLEDLLERLRTEMEKKTSISAKIGNNMFISRSGSALFFPAFSGIAINIISFSYSINPQLGTQFASALAIILLGYILATNITLSRFSAGGTARKIINAALYCAIAAAVFQLSSYLTLNFLVS